MNGFKMFAGLMATLLTVGTSFGARQVEESLVALSAHCDVRALNYSNSSGPDTTVVFTDLLREPLRIVIEIGNNTDRTLEVGTRDLDVASALSFQTLWEHDANRQDISGGVTARVITALPGNSASMSARRAITIRAVLEREDKNPFSPGLYELHVALNESALSPFAARLNNILSRTIRFEVKEARTDPERADSYLQLSYQARLSGRFAESRQWAEKALALNRVSIPALTDVASSWLDGEANCSQAAPLYRQAIVLLNTGADAQLSLTDVSRHDLVSALRGKLATRCGVK